MSQSLSDLPLFRKTDPATSREAAATHALSGKRQTHCELLLEAVRRRPGRTSLELTADTGLERHEVSRRLADLKNEGTVFQGEARRVNGRLMVTWFRTET